MPFKFSSRLAAASWIAGSSLLSFAPAARAQDEAAQSPATDLAPDEKTSCIQSFEQAQRDRAAARLLEAKDRLLECARPVCGTSLMSECTQMYSDVDLALPSVVLFARDEATNTDLTDVEVTLNGRVITTRLNGTPIPIDPGEQEFVFSATGHEPIKHRAVVGAGDKYRSIKITFPNPNANARQEQPSVAPASASLSTAQPAPEVPVMSWVLGGAAVVGIGAGVVLRVISNNDFDAMKQGCAARGCPEPDIDTLEQKYVLSTVAFGVGAAAAVGAALWYVIDGPSSEATTLAIVPAPDGGGAFATAQGHF